MAPHTHYYAYIQKKKAGGGGKKIVCVDEDIEKL